MQHPQLFIAAVLSKHVGARDRFDHLFLASSYGMWHKEVVEITVISSTLDNKDPDLKKEKDTKITQKRTNYKKLHLKITHIYPLFCVSPQKWNDLIGTFTLFA